MNEINDFNMKTLESYLNEGKSALYTEIQDDGNNGAAYNTLDIGKAKNKYKMGFISITEDQDIIVLEAFNKPSDLSDLLGGGEDFSVLTSLKVGETTHETFEQGGPDEIVIRIW